MPKLLALPALLAWLGLAYAGDLPSGRAGEGAAVDACASYGLGYYLLPKLETCVSFGGSVRAEFQYTPARDIYDVSDGSRRTTYTSVYSSSSGNTTLYAPRNMQDEIGLDMRGRISIDARTPTEIGDARTLIRLRYATTSGLANTAISNSYGYSNLGDMASAVTTENAVVQVAHVTFGLANSNYALMPSFFYHAAPWATYFNGVKQLAYTQLFGSGLSATVALEDRRDHLFAGNVAQATLNGTNYVGNLRLDHHYGFIAAHALLGFNSYYVKSTGYAPTSYASDFTALGSSSAVGSKTHDAYALGLTAKFKLPTGSEDEVWLTANYAYGASSALVSDGGLSNIGTLGTHRLLGGVVRLDPNILPTNNVSAASSTVGTVTGHNYAAAFVHHWTQQWRSQFNAGYVEMDPPRQRQTAQTSWGRGRLYEATVGAIYSPIPKFDLGVEVQAARIHNQLQNPTTAFKTAGMPGLMDQNISTKLRAERSF